jgi:hypothetical protein
VFTVEAMTPSGFAAWVRSKTRGRAS